MIGRELKRILQKPAALVCIIVYIGIMILGVETDLRADHESGILSLFYFTENYGVTAFIQTLIFPIAAAGNYFDERKGHYDWLMQMRSGQMKYCFAKIVSAVLSGIILYMISVLLFFCFMYKHCTCGKTRKYSRINKTTFWRNNIWEHRTFLV